MWLLCLCFVCLLHTKCHKVTVTKSILNAAVSRNFPHSPTLVKCGVLLLLIPALATIKGKIFPLVTEKILVRVVDFAARFGCFRV